MINGYLIGDRELVRRLKKMPADAVAKVRDTVIKLGFDLQARVQRNYLTGQVLRVRTGRLKNSITQSNADSRSRLVDNGAAIYYYVGTNVKYGAVWEYGGKPFTIVPTKKKALRFMVNGSAVFAKRCNVPGRPARPFLKPALEDMRPVIVRELGKALKDSMENSLNN